MANGIWLGGLALALGCTTAWAVPIAAGTAEYVTSRYCIAGVTACDDVSPIVGGRYGGAPGATSSSAELVTDGIGRGAGSVTLSGTVGAPKLTALADSLAGGRMNTNSVALQRYTYTGATTTTRHFSGTLSFAQTVTTDRLADTGVSAIIDLFALPTQTIEVGETAQSNFEALYDVSSLAGYRSIDSASYRSALTDPAGSGLFGASVTLNPGDSIWVWVLLQTPAANGSVVDATHTLLTRWEDASNLAPAAVVPELPTAAMLALGLMALAMRRREH